MKPLALAFLWHLHQPPYRLRDESVCFMPWVRLHALRSYYDMARVLEEHPEIRVTFNITATLIEQLRAYERGGSDLFRETARLPAGDLDDARRAFLFEHFVAGGDRSGEPARYAEIHGRREAARRIRGAADAWKELTTEDYRDLQVLFDLSWFGFKAREDFPEARALIDRGGGYTPADVATLHAIEDEIVRRVLPLYRAAAADGRIEITTTPYAHPILPLVIDTDSAREALPHAALPARFRFPADARRHIEDARALVERELGTLPRGLWPAEGGISRDAVRMMGECGIDWTAADEQVLAASETLPRPDHRHPWTLAGARSPVLVFRDHDLSDRIGFSYARADPQRSADEFLATVMDRAGGSGDGRLLLVALDGENPWEHYPQSGGPFLRALYGAARRHRELVCDTISGAIARCAERGSIVNLRAGSWIQADFGTWIGGPEKNRAWSVLGEVRSALAQALESAADPARARAAWSSLRAAEASDWFWWLDHQHPTSYSREFDDLFRGHLRQACEALGLPAPASLDWPIPLPRRAEDSGAGDAGLSAPPRVDGFEEDAFEWQGAASLDWDSVAVRGTMQTARPPLASLRYGFAPDGAFCLRVDPGPGSGTPPFAGWEIDLRLGSDDAAGRVRVTLDRNGDLESAGAETAIAPGDKDAARVRAAGRNILEMTVPRACFGIDGRAAALHMKIRLRTATGTIDLRDLPVRVPRLPSTGGGEP